jgi:pyruvate kinase
VGRYPLATVAMMDRIIREAEASVVRQPRRRSVGDLDVAETVAEAVCHAADELRMKVIAVFTESGSSARLVSKYRPPIPIIAFSPKQETRRRLSLLWGVLPRTIEAVRDIDEVSLIAERRLREERLAKRGDVVGIIAGTPFGIAGSTNLMKLHVIGGAR